MDTIRSTGGAAGVRIERCLLGSRSSDARPPGIDGWPGYRSAGPDELPAGFTYGFWLDMTVVDMSRYLPYLADRYRAAGGAIEIGRVESLDDLTGDVVVNCAGIGARALTDDDTLTGRWGMHTVVANPGIDYCFMEGPPGQAEWVAWMPHGDKILIGGIIDDDADHPTPNTRHRHRHPAAHRSRARRTPTGRRRGPRPHQRHPTCPYRRPGRGRIPTIRPAPDPQLRPRWARCHPLVGMRRRRRQTPRRWNRGSPQRSAVISIEEIRTIALGLPGSFLQESYGGRPSWRTKSPPATTTTTRSSSCASTGSTTRKPSS